MTPHIRAALTTTMPVTAASEFRGAAATGGPRLLLNSRRFTERVPTAASDCEDRLPRGPFGLQKRCRAAYWAVRSETTFAFVTAGGLHFPVRASGLGA